ncbi:MAG: ABC transporter ATP-binding protein [Deltaproteobacteria bacterium]|nr:ABC transporter ATP-binding protein [Deltaproteobacteria bacterium]MBW1962667.1 ABC transporter ATP-binding protein [Deltaproteobacteria bacterium]MBW1993881.1 ABC transporter ATP-binding protein [Deltaproteobacteria bacterium]MBW2153449.1 ABC transporter ATP-binding protein [Deltaproteobacteria bacterium]
MAFELEQVSFSYNRKRAIDALFLSLEQGKFYGIIGPNGCGKSTLLDLLVGHRKPESGHIRYKEKELASYSRRDLSKEIALVPQNFYINFPYTAADIVMMGRYPYIPRFSKPTEKDLCIVREIMVKTETEAFMERYITELSGGERQRVVIARALVQDTRFLLLDEATSNLDINHALKLLNLAREKTEKDGKTVVAVMQNINLAAMYCDELIFMKNGRIVTSGAVEDILTEETIHRVFNVESEVQFQSYANTKQVVFKR